MGLREDIQTDLAESFDGDLADAVFAIQYFQYTGTGNYDPATGSKDQNYTELAASRGVFDKEAETKVINSATRSTSAELIILQNELAGTPKKYDKIVGKGRDWIVEDIGNDPADATWVLGVHSNAV